MATRDDRVLTIRRHGETPAETDDRLTDLLPGGWGWVRPPSPGGLAALGVDAVPAPAVTRLELRARPPNYELHT